MAGGENPSPKRIAKLLARGAAAPHPLFVPLAFALGAQVEGMDVDEFILNPTKLAKGLEALRQALGTEAIVCCCSAAMEAEAAGAELDWGAYPPAVVTHPLADGPAPAGFDPQRLVSSPRISTAIEVTRRLAATSTGEPLLVAALTGPLTLAGQLGGPAAGFELLEVAGAIGVELVRQFCQAGVGAVVLVEDHLPRGAEPAFETWCSVVAPLAKVARFHQALPILVVSGSSALPGPALEARTPGGLLLCTPVLAGTQGAARRPLGLALPAQPAEWPATELACDLLTTGGEVPYQTPVESLCEACGRIQKALRMAEPGH